VHNIIGTWCIFSNEGEGGGRRALSGGRGGGARSARRKVTAWGVVSRQAEAMETGHLPLAVLALILFGLLSNADSQTKVYTELISFSIMKAALLHLTSANAMRAEQFLV